MDKAEGSRRPHAENLLVIERDLGELLAGVSELLPAVAAVLDAVLSIEGFDCGGVYIIDPATGALDLLVTRGLSEPFVSNVSRFAADSPRTRLIMHGRPVYMIYDDLVDREFFGERPAEHLARREPGDPSRVEGLRAIAVVPIKHQGEVIGCINGSSHTAASIPKSLRRAMESIASRVGMAIARIRAEERLRASEERIRAVYENAVDGILLVDLETMSFIDGNPSICRMLGRLPGDICSLSVRDIHPPEALASVFETFARYQSHGEQQVTDIPMLRRDKTVFLADINASEVSLDGRRMMLGIFRDVTERHRLQAEMTKTQRLESIGVLAGGIAHDFNNILTGISGNLSLAMMLVQQDEALLDLLRTAGRAADRAAELTRQLLTFARGGSPVRRSADVGEIIRDAAGFVLRGSAAIFSFSPPRALWAIDADPGQIGQVIQNLVLNAAEAMPDGGEVTVTAANIRGSDGSLGASSARFVRISVADNGCGMTPDLLGRIFDPYFTTKETGSGLGLAVCYSIVHKHGGRIEVESRVGAGTTFHVYLPAANDAPRHGSPGSAGSQAGSGRVLVMDDDEVVLDVSSRMLERLGYVVSTAADGAAAIEVVRRAREEGRSFDIAILDLTIPGGMGGIDCARRLLEIAPEIKLVVSSGYSNDPAMSDPGGYGFQAVIAKPFRMEDLRDALGGLS